MRGRNVVFDLPIPHSLLDLFRRSFDQLDDGIHDGIRIVRELFRRNNLIFEIFQIADRFVQWLPRSCVPIRSWTIQVMIDNVICAGQHFGPVRRGDFSSRRIGRR